MTEIELAAAPSGRTPINGYPYSTPDDSVDVPRDIQALAMALDPQGTVPVGAVMMWMGSVAPTGWLLLTGQQVAAATYPGLAAIFGQVGGNVALPDMRDSFPMGASAGTALGSQGGAAGVSLTAAQSGMPSHNHGALTGASDRSLAHAHTLHGNGTAFAVSPPVGNGTFAGIINQSGGGGWWASDTLVTGSQWTPDHLHSIATEAARNASQSHENRPPFRAVNFIIRAG